MNSDTKYMNRALELAARGKGHVSPNPCVGCVIVKNGVIVGEGYHRQFGGPHAEIYALRQAGNDAFGADMYVTLEPCTHWGKTPPCAPELVKAGLKRVFIGVKDPNPSVSGAGIRMLRTAGIKVKVGVESQAIESLIRSYLTWRRKNRPYVILKLAMSLDGKIASKTGDSRWISEPESRQTVHLLRAESDGILVGCGTVLRDNPHLTSHGKGRNPIRFILDPHMKVSLNAHVMRDKFARTIVLSDEKNEKQIRRLKRLGIGLISSPLKNGLINIRDILKSIAKINVSQLLVEGGGETSWSFLKARLVDEVWIFIAPKIVGGRNAKTPVEGTGFSSIAKALKLEILSWTRIGNDFLVRAKPR